MTLLRKKSKGREKTSFSFANARKVDASPVPNVAGSEIHTIVTYDHETHFDVNTTKFGGSVLRESSFEVITFEKLETEFSGYVGQVFSFQLNNHAYR